MSSEHVIVIGGGIIGLSSAYHLLRKGAQVTLIERDGFTTSASTGNAGFIVLGHPPLPRPGLTRQAMAMLFDQANPLYIPPRLDWTLIRWLWAFRKACNEKQFRHSMEVFAELGWFAGEAFDWIVQEERIECDYHRQGWMEIFETEHRLEHGRSDAALLREYGYTFDELSGQELRAQEPAFKDNVIGALRYRESGAADPARCVQALAKAVQQRGGTIVTGRAVREIVMADNRAQAVELDDGQRMTGDQVVLAAGIWSEALASRVGVRVPMQPAKGYHMNLAMPEVAPSKTCLLADVFVGVNPTCNGLRLAGTLEFSGVNDRIIQRRLDMLKINASRFLHGVQDAEVLSTWCGLRPCTADGLPVIGYSPRVSNLFIATGHAMLGFGLGPATGQLVAEAVSGQAPSVDLTPMSPARYD